MLNSISCSVSSILCVEFSDTNGKYGGSVPGSLCFNSYGETVSGSIGILERQYTMVGLDG